MGFDGEGCAFGFECVAVFVEVAVEVEAEVVCAPLGAVEVAVGECAVAGLGAGLFAGSLATDEYIYAVEGDSVLRCTANFADVLYFAAEDLFVPGCGGLGIFADDVNVVEHYLGFAHFGCLLLLDVESILIETNCIP